MPITCHTTSSQLASTRTSVNPQITNVLVAETCLAVFSTGSVVFLKEFSTHRPLKIAGENIAPKQIFTA